MPYSTGLAGVLRLSVPIVNHVERSPSADAGARAADRAVPLRADQGQRADAAVCGGAGLDVEQRPARAEPLAELQRAELQRAPVVVGRERVVGIGHGDEVRRRLRAPDVLDVRRPAARAREEERLGELALVEHDLARGAVDGVARGARLGGDPAVDLAARVRVDVEVTETLHVGQRIGAGHDRLRLERLGGPRVGHLPRHDAPQVLLEADRVHDADGLAAGHLQRAAVVAVAERERRRPGREDERSRQRLGGRGELQLQARPELLLAGRQLVRLAVRVLDRERRARGDDDALRPGHEQHAHALHRRGAEVGAGVVVGDDVGGGPAVQGIAVGAVLREPDAVAPAVAGDEERPPGRRRRVRRRGSRETQGGEEGCCECADHRLEGRPAARRIQAGRHSRTP